MTALLIILIFAVLLVAGLYNMERRRANAKEEALTQMQQLYSELLSQKKSSEIRTGMITEQLAPFLKNFGHDPMRCRFLGDPIDFVVFEDDKITFVEVKTGKAPLTVSQRKIKNHVAERNVVFEIFRLDAPGPDLENPA